MDQVEDDDDNGVEDDDDNKKVSERIFVPEWWPNQWSQSRSKKPQLELPEPPKGSESAVSTNVISGQTRPGKGIFDDLMGTPSNDQTGSSESYPPIFHFYKDSSAQCHPHSPLFPACLLGLHFLPTSMIGGNTDPGDLFISTAILHLLHPPARILEIGDGSTTISDHLNDRHNFEYIHVPSSSLGSQYNWSLILSNYLPVCTQENLSPGEDCPWTVESIIELQNEQIEEERRRTEYNQQFNLFSAIIGSIFASFLFFMMHISRIKDHFVTFFNKLRGIEPPPKPQEPPKLAFPFADLVLPSKSRSLDSLMIDRPQPPPSVDFLRSKSPLPTNSSSSSSSSFSSPVVRPDSISIVALDLQQPARSDQKEGGEEQPKPEQKEEEKNKQEEETKKEEQLEERKEPEEEEKVERMTKTRQSSVEVLKIGRLEISRKVLGYGSSGTIVYEGRLGHRRVAVKRMLADFYKIADKEVELLLKSDEHPNVVSYFTHEEDGQFIYLALTFCSMTLETFVELKALGSKSHSSSSFPVAGRHSLKDKRLNESSPLPLEEDFALKQMISDLPEPSVDVMNGIGSLPMVKAVIKDVLQGVSHLHQLNIVHRDLKPQNVLIDPNGRARISDMGLAKRLDGHSMSFSSNVKGSWGWQAPEVLMGKRGSDRVDLFSIGCLAFYLLTGGLHPFGEALERELNIRDYRIVGLDRHSRRSKKPQSPSSSSSSSSSSRPIRVIGSGPAKPRSREETVNVWTRGGLRDQLEKKKEEAERAVEKEKEEDKTMAEITPEAEDLIRSLIHKEPQLRPSAQEALFHPFFWGARECLTFLRDASDRLEIEQLDKPIVLDFEARFATVCGGAQNNWFRDIIDDPLKKELSAGRFRKYNGQTLRDLLRLVRNKAHHFRDLPDDVRELFQNDLPDGFLRYFTMRFPRLVIETYCTIRKFCRHEATFGGYFGEDSLPTKTSTSSSSSSSSSS